MVNGDGVNLIKSGMDQRKNGLNLICGLVVRIRPLVCAVVLHAGVLTFRGIGSKVCGQTEG